MKKSEKTLFNKYLKRKSKPSYSGCNPSHGINKNINKRNSAQNFQGKIDNFYQTDDTFKNIDKTVRPKKHDGPTVPSIAFCGKLGKTFNNFFAR